MSVKVRKVLNVSPFLWRTEKDGSHVLKRTATLCFEIEKDGFVSTAKIRFCGDATDSQGFRCDGLSVPRLLRWFLPSWDELNGLYNVAGAVHSSKASPKRFFALSISFCIFSSYLAIWSSMSTSAR